jgi:hypothetical protein
MKGTNESPTDVVLPFFRRLAALGHFVEFKIRFQLRNGGFKLPESAEHRAFVLPAHCYDGPQRQFPVSKTSRMWKYPILS